MVKFNVAKIKHLLETKKTYELNHLLYQIAFPLFFFILGDKIYLFKGETRGSFQRKKEVTFVVTSIEMCGYLRH